MRAFKNWGFSRFRINFWGQKSTRSFWKWFSYLNIKIGEQLLLTIFWILFILKKYHLVKTCPIFLQLTPKLCYKISRNLWGCSFGCKKILNFTWNTIKLPNHCYANEHTWAWFFFQRGRVKKWVSSIPVFFCNGEVKIR